MKTITGKEILTLENNIYKTLYGFMNKTQAQDCAADIVHSWMEEHNIVHNHLAVKEAIEKIKKDGTEVDIADRGTKEKGFDYVIGRTYPTKYTEDGHPYNDSWGVNLTEEELIEMANNKSNDTL